jgi:serine/threonine protein kinase/tetratricopeptide (TPR) repeat protein
MVEGLDREEALFHAALAIDAADQRSAFLDAACGHEEGLRRRVEALLRRYAESEGPLDRPVLPTATTPDNSIPEGPGTVIGPYKLLEQIGEGGMGLVFMAEQTQPVRRKVALKVLKPGMDTKQVVTRFEAERQALALMDHPNIAKIHDAGTTASGRPYFVMELVRGVPITEFCDQRRLSTRQRLELFVLVCQAVQHAHQKGIIHRDLKPSNVLVTLHDVVAVPKVIDFGIAKATGQRLTERTLFTHFAQFVGTPLYVSPEQAEMNGLDVDTRSDVYSLGVLLYELLTGTTPFESETLKQVGLDEMRRIIREEEPPTPSQRLSTLDALAGVTVSERRGVDGRWLGQVLRGELDWIVMKALEKDRNRRYESASALAADVERYLADEPVEAGPPSRVYRLRKCARRHRRLLAVAGLFAVVLVGATAVSAWQAVKARGAQRQAATEAAIARAVNAFLQEDLLGQAASAPQPGQNIGENPYLTVKEALDRAAARIGQRFQEQPLVEAAIRTTIGSAYHNLYENQLAIPHLEWAVKLRDDQLGPDHPDTLDSKHSLAVAYMERGRHQEAIVLCQEIVESRKARLGPEHPETRARLGSLANAYTIAGQYDTSAHLWAQLLEKHQALYGPTHPTTLGTMNDLARCYAYMGRLTESIALHETLLERVKSTNGCDPYWPLLTFAVTCQRAGNFNRADRLFREVLDHCRRQADSYQARLSTTDPLGFLAQNLFLQQRYDEAEPLIREALSIFEKHRPEDPKRFYWMNLLGGVLCGQERYSEAEPLLLQGYEETKKREALMNANWRTRLPQAGERVVLFYEATNQPEKARAWREKLAAAKPLADRAR